MKVFLTRIIANSGYQALQNAGIEIVPWEEKRDLTPDELISYSQDCQALLSVGPNQINAQFLEQCKHLKVISLQSVGFDNVDIETANELKIPIGNTPGVLSMATADTAFLLMLASSRKAFYLNQTIRNGEWNFFEPNKNLGIELNGKTLGIYGLGKIGFEMAKKAIGAFDIKILYHNRNRNQEAENAIQATYVSFEELLSRSDVISVHTSLTDETREKFNLEVFAKMKPTAIFINTARGGIHNEKDLIHALNHHMIWGAGLDVTNPEPMDQNNPLLNMPSVAILPHIGSATEETRSAMSKIAAENVIAGLQGKRLPFPVNPEVYD